MRPVPEMPLTSRSRQSAKVREPLAAGWVRMGSVMWCSGVRWPGPVVAAGPGDGQLQSGTMSQPGADVSV
jgi:hypothetical protein